MPETNMPQTIMPLAPEAEPLEADAIVTLTDEERQPCEVWTRVMGYHRPVASFNIGKRGEYDERRGFTVAAPVAR